MICIFRICVLCHRHRFDLNCVVYSCISLLKQNYPLLIYEFLTIKLDSLTNGMKNVISVYNLGNEVGGELVVFGWTEYSFSV